MQSEGGSITSLSIYISSGHMVDASAFICSTYIQMAPHVCLSNI